MNKLISLLLLMFVAGSANGMGGAPVFLVGHKMTGMTAEATHSVMDVNSPSSVVAEDQMISDRVMLTARYGLLPMLEFAAQVGTANLRFEDLPPGYNAFDAGWGVAWGADIRGGYPTIPAPYQVLGAVKYFGFRPEGATSNEQRTVENKYLWHEVTPTLTAGYALGAVVPYVGFAKTYLFGERDVKTSFDGREFPAASGTETFSDGEQPIRALIGLEWRGPDGYLISGEAAAAAGGLWTFSVGLTQVLK